MYHSDKTIYSMRKQSINISVLLLNNLVYNTYLLHIMSENYIAG